MITKEAKMPKKTTIPNRFIILRNTAEEIFSKQPPIPNDLLAEDIIHELQVHQIELEIQNEELQRVQADLAASQARYFELYDLAPVGYCIISEEGQIMEANLTAASFLGVKRSKLGKRFFSRFIFKADQGIYYDFRKQLFETRVQQKCELRLLPVGSVPFWVRLDATVAQDAHGSLLCRLVMSDTTERKQVEEKLRLTQFAIDSAADAIFWATDDGDIVDVNEAACRLLGYTRDELLQRTVPEIDANFTKENYLKQFTELSKESSLSFESLQIHKDGRLIPVDITANYIEFEDKKLNCAFIRDITERKRVEEKLQKSESSTRAMFENSVASFLFIDRDKNIQAFNRIAKERTFAIFGKELHQGDSIYEIVFPHEREIFDQHYQLALEGELVCVEKMYKREVEYWYEFNYAPVYAENGQVTGVFFSIMDITARKHVDEALSESEEKFRCTIQQSSEGILICEENGEIIEWNKAQADIFGSPREKMLGTMLWDFQYSILPAEQKNEENYLRMKQSILSIDKIEKADWMNKPNVMQVICENGKMKTIQVTAFTIDTQRGTLFAAIISDISERKELEQKMLHSQKMANIGTLTAGIAHELNSPLQVITGISDSLLGWFQIHPPPPRYGRA